MKYTPFDSPALAFRARGYPFGDRVPYRVRMLKNVMSEFPGRVLHLGDACLVARKGEEYPAWVNSYGAVAAIVNLGDHTESLGVKPGEFEVIAWHHDLNSREGE